MTDQDQTMSELQRAMAESVATLLAKHAEHKHRVDQMLTHERLAAIRASSRAHRRDLRRKVIVGGAVLDEAVTNPEFRTQLYEILARRIIDPRDRDCIAEDDDKEAGVAGTIALSGVVPPSDAEFKAMAEQRLDKANSSNT